MRTVTVSGEALRTARLAADLRQEDLAAAAGLSLRWMKEIEKDGEPRIYPQTLAKLRTALHAHGIGFDPLGRPVRLRVRRYLVWGLLPVMSYEHFTLLGPWPPPLAPATKLRASKRARASKQPRDGMEARA